MRPHLITMILLALALPPAGFAQGQQPTSLPVGDGRISDRPRAGSVFSCTQKFRTGGARHVGDWFHGETWDPAAKPHVQGRVMWPDATFRVQVGDGDLRIIGNGLPVGQPTGSFPIARTDPANAHDTNPNAITPTAIDISIPQRPQRAAVPACVGMGMIGISVTGVALYNALDDAGRDAAAHEVQDTCDGHPMGRGQYNYHSASPCLPGVDGNWLVGWALDGYPILGKEDAAGKRISNADLDACHGHGRAETVSVSGLTYDYTYRMTAEYPYIIGCFTGRVPAGIAQALRQGMGPRQNGPRRRAQP